MRKHYLYFLLVLFISLMAVPLFSAWPGTALNFESGDYISGSGIGCTYTNGVTLEAWVKHNTFGTGIQRYITISPEIAVLRYGGSTSGGLGQLHFYIKNASGTLKHVTAYVLVLNEWMHVAGAYDGTTMNLYCNGNIVATNTASPGPMWDIGDGTFQISRSDEAMRGEIDEVRMHNDDKPWASIRENRFRYVGLTDYVCVWSLDDGSGTTAYESETWFNANGTLYNMTNANWVTSTVPNATYLPGNAGSFNSSTSTYINLEQRSGLPIYNNGTANAYSVSMWVKGAAQNAKAVYAEGNTSGTGPIFLLGTTSAGKMWVYIYNGSSGGMNRNSTTTVFDDTWHHIAWVDNNGTATLYIDGVADGTNFNYTRTAISLNTCTIGAYRYNLTAYHFTGQIDELCLWKTALTASDVKHYLRGLGLSTDSNLTGMYQFNESSGPAYDFGYGNTGTLLNSATRVSSTAPIGPSYWGSLSTNTTWSNSIVYVVDDLTVNDTVTLTVTPGIQVKFDGWYAISVQGRVLAVGTSADSIRFTSDKAAKWRGLRFYSTPATNDSSKFEYCVFTNALAGTTSPDYMGSAIGASSFSKILINFSSFRSNHNPCPAFSGGGGAASFYNSNAIIRNSAFIGNSCTNASGAIALQASNLTIESCKFLNNTATYTGGALVVSNSSAQIKNCIFKGNSAGTTSGAVEFRTSSGWNVSSIQNSIIDGNTAGTDGGGFCLVGTFNLASITNCTIINNNAQNGGALYLSGSDSNKDIRNCILWGNSATNGNQVRIGASTAASFYYNDIQGGLEGFSYNSGAPLTGTNTGNINIDPQVSYSVSNPGSGYVINNLSACINGGDPATSLSGTALRDINGNTRFYNNTLFTGNLNIALDRIDIGAIEDQNGALIIPTGTILEQNYTFNSSIYLYSEKSMTVNAGVTLYFAPNVLANIYGNLTAVGTPGNMITFTEATSGSRWKGLTFSSSGSAPFPTSRMEYCIVEKGNLGTGNEALGGNILIWYYNSLTMVNCIIRDGYCDEGGAMYLRNSTVTMKGCAIYNNVCITRGTGVYSNNSTLKLINCTIADNTKTGAQSPPANLASVYFSSTGTQPQITNCIIRGTNSPIYADVSLTNVTYNDVQGGYTGTGNVDVNPYFKGTGTHPYGINSWSYCINMGTADTTGLSLPSTDILGNPRIHSHTNTVYNRIDMGAYENPGYLAAADVSATDGNSDYPGYVYIQWIFNTAYNIPPNGFRVYRNGNNLDTVDGSTYTYCDYNVMPGTIYTYYVQSYYNTETSNSASDNGYLKPNGIISGNVKTTNNNPVMNVKVSLSPSNGNCLYLSAASSASVYIPSPQVNLNQSFTLEVWVKTATQNINIINTGTHYLKINSTGKVQYTDGLQTLTQTSTAVNVNDGNWHHIAIVSDVSDNKVKMYINDIIAAQSTSYAFCNYTQTNFTIPVGITGYIDDIRIWSVVRDSSQIVDNKGIVLPYNASGLKGYWAMNEGTGTSIYDATNYSNNGTATNCTWSASDPGMAYGALTNAWGDYIITQIAYGNFTTFTVLPSKTGHMFQPEQRLVTLSSSNIAVNNVDFTDNSMIPISGYVKFQSTNVPVENALIKLNGEDAVPRVSTNSDGYYVLEVEHGTACQVSVNYKGHQFNRVWDLGTVTYPRPNINFEDIFKTEYKLEVVGGQDSYPIGDFNVTMASVNGLYTREITNGNWSAGWIMVNNVPPLDYNVTVNPGVNDPFGLVVDTQFQSNKTKRFNQVDADSAADTLRYEWRAPLQVEVIWPDSLDLHHFTSYPLNEFYVLTQNEWYSVLVKACEDYSYTGHPNQKSYLTDCSLTVNDEIGIKGETEHEFDGSDSLEYSFVPFLPNINSGYDRQYQNIIEFTVHDQVLERNVTASNWAITQGVKPLETTFATTSPEIPFMILHDPPGDCSTSSFNTGNSHTVTIGSSVCTNREFNIYRKLNLAPTLRFEAGTPFFNKETELKYIFEINDELAVESEQKSTDEQSWKFSTSESISTSSSDDIIGDFGADVFMGGAVNLIWGVTKELYWDYDDEDIFLKQDMLVTPDGFATTYIYTESQIRNTVIPNLYTIGDSVSANMWQSYLDMNDYNKEHPNPNPNHPGNISFCAGPSYTYTEETESTDTHTFEFEVGVSYEFGLEIGLTVDGVGGVDGFKFKAALKVGGSQSSLYETTSSTSYTLEDDDVASDLTFNSDYFSVDVGVDPVYGTPSFKLVSGASSNHWEQNTQPRDGVMMSANSYTAVNIPQDQPAFFLLNLTNTSQTNELRRYYLTVQHATNTIGATVKINGVPLENQMAFDIDGGVTVPVVMSVEPGPFGHELEDLTLEFYALGDRGYEGPDGHYFDIYKSFDIYWEAPYSRVAINYPQNGWLINQAQNDTMDIVFTGYNLSKPKFKSIKLEYKHPQDVTWLPAFEVMRNVLEDHPSYITVPWDVSGLSDGIYEIRAATTDSVQANWYTAALQGTIDRSAPAVWGLPQPSDGILQLGDVISLSFSENLDPNSLLPGRVSMVEVGGPLVVDCNVQFNENAISIVPSIANYWMENKTFRVTVMGLTDIHGNPMASSVQWEFFVNANPVNWATTKVELIKQLGQSSNFSVILCNNGGQYSSFSLIDLPPWLSATPLSGNLLPLDSRPISFTVSTQLGFGVFTDTLYADIPGLGKEPLVVKVSVLASPPTWATSVVTNYDYSMTITGQMYIDNELSTDINDIIGAFVTVNGALQCRGVAHTEFVPYQSGSYQFFLTIYSNEEYEEDLIFKVWDASQCKEHYGIMESYDFFAEIVYGTPVTPVSVHAAPQLIQNVSCNTGWNWITTNVVNSTSMNVNQVLQSLSPVNNDLIKDQTQYAQYSAGMGWVGSLQTISTTKAYKIKLGAQGNLSMVGLLENPNTTSLTYGTGWNWIGYLPHVSIHVNEALSGITNLQTGDVIKSQQYYAQYIAGSGWFGSLTFMHPGCGYMLKTANSGSFYYPDYVIPRTNPPDTENRTFTRLRDNSGWNLNPQQYEYTSNITAVINNNGSLLNNENVLLGAFYNGECRGYASPVLIQDQWVFFLTQYSNTMNQTMTYKVYLEDDDETIIANEMLPFINNQILGNPLNPYVFHISYAPLTAPENLSISCEDNTITLHWNTVPGAASYKVYASNNPALPFEQWALIAENITLCEWSQPVAFSCRFYKVVASSAAGRESSRR